MTSNKLIDSEITSIINLEHKHCIFDLKRRQRQSQSQTSLHFRDVNNQTKEYLGYPVSDDQRNDLDTSSTNSDYESDSDDVYQAGIERSPRIAPQITEPDDEIYGEFDPNLAIQNEIMVRNRSISLLVVNCY